MDDVQSWPEVPSIAHFCSLFRAAFNLLDFDIDELEEALLTDGTEDAGSSLLQELIVRLLCGCIQNNEISTFNYQMFLRRLFRQKCQEYGRENPFNTDIDFQFLPLRVKVEILHALCDFRLDAIDVPELLKNLESDSLRVEPLGFDENKSAYWYFYGTRLYREDFPKVKKKLKERKKRRKEDKKRRRASSDSDNDLEDSGAGVWQVVCFTEGDWVELAEKLKGSTCKAERELYRTLVDDFLPEIPRLFAQKEKQQERKRSAEYHPRTRRQSSRLGKMKYKDSHDNGLDEDRLRLERGQRERRERLDARRSSESDFIDSAASDVEDLHAVGGKEGRPAGRQTNNSLSSAMGQIIIRPPKRKKLRSKQVFKTSAEDLRTGMYKILDYVKGQEDAWPFLTPVDENYAPRYYSVIRRPMDLRRMEEKLDAGHYKDLNHFRDDFQLIVDNCRQYNGSENEYTEMVTNLLEAFNEAVNRFLEPDPSSDEEVAVDFTDLPRHKERRHREHKDSKRLKVKRKKRDRSKMDSMSDSDSDRPTPSYKQQKERSSVSDNEGSVPGSDFDDREPDFLRETSPPRLEKAHSDSDEPRPSRPPPQLQQQQSSRRSGRGRHNQQRRGFDNDDLNAATEKTLKDITGMLEDVPILSGFSSRSNSPNQFMDDFSSDPRPIMKQERSFKNPRDGARRRKPIDLLRNVKRKDIRTIDRLQPGKSKGNLLGNISKPKDHADESAAALALGMGRTGKEGRNALLVKTDDAGPKLSLGTVLKSDILDFGKSKHNFDASVVLLETSSSPSMDNKIIEDSPPEVKINEEEKKSPIPAVIEPKLPEPPPIAVKEEDSSINKENDPVIEKRIATGTEDKKRDGVKEITNKSAPNASAWFKAFGAPKAPTTVKKKIDPPEPAPVVEEKESSWGVASVPPPASRRQRKASSSSSMSEPSSLSQDSPLHPVSPGLVSPRGEPPAPPINGTLRVGFYQDMSSVHKSSPEKQSPRSTHSSPREINNPSPFQSYSHVYPPSSPGTYSNYSAQMPLPQPAQAQQQPVVSSSHLPPASIYDNLSQYSSYSDQYRQSYSSYNKQPEPVTPKPNPSIFPVKKRIYANVEQPSVPPPQQPRIIETPKEPVPNMYKDMGERYPMENPYQQRQYIPDDKTMHQQMSDSMQNSRLSSDYHPEMMSMGISSDGKAKYPGSDRNLNVMLESLGRMPSPAHGYPLERLMQPTTVNTIQEDSDGVFRNKFATDSAYGTQRHQPTAVSAAYPTTNLSHMVDRYEDDRLTIPNPYYDKNLYLKNVASSSTLPMYQDQQQQSSGYELNIPKHRDAKSIKKKKGVKSPDTGTGVVTTTSTAFQHYVGLKPNEPCAPVPPISLKTTGTLPGSAFNYGPGLTNPLYSEGYLDELRQPTYYGMEKPPFLAPPARGSSYTIPQYMGHQPGPLDGYQQFYQRVHEEQLRQSLAYPPGYHPALGIRPTYDRHTWL